MNLGRESGYSEEDSSIDDSYSYAESGTPYIPSKEFRLPQNVNYEITHNDSDNTYPGEKLLKANSITSRTESLFQKHFKNDSEDDNISVLERPNMKLTLKLSPRDKFLLIESWYLMLNDDLTEEDLTQFSQKIQNKGINGIFQTNSRGFRSPNSNLNISQKDYNSNTDSASQVVKEPDFNRKEYDKANIGKSLFCTQFYENLVNMDPQIKRAFPAIRHQAVSFTILIDTAMDNLDDITLIDKRLESIGKRHTRILGIDNGKFEVMGRAFTTTLHDRLGITFSHELEEIWTRLYTYFANSLLIYGVDPVLQKKVPALSVKSNIEEGNSIEFASPQVVFSDKSSQELSMTPLTPAFSMNNSSGKGTNTSSVKQQSKYYRNATIPQNSKPKRPTLQKANHSSEKNTKCCVM